MNRSYSWRLCAVAATAMITLIAGCFNIGQQDVAGHQDAAEQVDRRHVELQGQSNFRDVGGYKTKDGRTVKWAQVFRSGELPKLTEQDVEKLGTLPVASVINFLTDQEIEAHGKDRLPEGTRRLSMPIEGMVGDLSKNIRTAIETADFSHVPADLNLEIHRILIRDAAARKEYANLLKTASDSENRPLVLHCSHGIHRTGTGTAILLSALGVPWETIREDYLLSNKYREAEVQERLEQLRQLAAANQKIAPEQVEMANFEAFYVLQAA